MWKINLITGVFLLILGILIIRFKMAYLIAGYNTSSKQEKEKYNEDMLVRYVGGLLIISACILLLGGLLGMFMQEFGSTVFLVTNILFVLCILGGLIYINLTKAVRR